VTLLGLNLRPAVTSIGALLTEIERNVDMSTAVAGVLVATPVACFAAGGWLAWTIRRHYGTTHSVTAALCALTLSLTIRVADGAFVLLAGTILTCLAIALLATLLPSIVQAAPPYQKPRLTTCYTVALGTGSAVGAFVTPWLAAATSWQTATASWALVAGAALMAWLTYTHHGGDLPPQVRTLDRTQLAPRRTMWALTVHFGLLTGYSFTIMGWLPAVLLDNAQVSAVEVRWMFGLSMTVAVPIVLWVPTWASRHRSQSSLVVLLAACSIIGTSGLLIAPAAAPWLWSGFIGLGMASIILAVILIQLRTRDVDSAAALSSVVNARGFAIAGAVALIVSQLHAVTDTWQWPLVALLVVLFGHTAVGVVAGQPLIVALVGHDTIPKEPALRPAQLTAGSVAGSSLITTR
jgi:CP family cyanate transporter-like MFS transporter